MYLRSVEYLFGNTVNVICPFVVLFSVLKNVCSCALCDLLTEYQNLILLLPVCNTGSSIILLRILHEFLSV